MELDISACNLQNSEDADFRIKAPLNCPHCGDNSSYSKISAFYFLNNPFKPFDPFNPLLQARGVKHLVVTFYCKGCSNLFFTQYKIPYDVCNFLLEEEIPVPVNIYPTFHASIAHPRQIESFSPRFVQTYKEAQYSEELGFMEICGIGYRKALEILIKDFAIKMHPEAKSLIEKKLSLNDCIEKYIDNPDARIFALASKNIGNDMTHYVRKHQDCTIEDMKSFIQLAESFINDKLELLKAETLIPSKN